MPTLLTRISQVGSALTNSPHPAAVARSAAIPRAMASPMPPVEPATMAVLPERSILIKELPDGVALRSGADPALTSSDLQVRGGWGQRGQRVPRAPTVSFL